MGVPQGDRPALPLMLLLQLQPPVPHAPYINSESYRRQPAQMEHRGLHLHTVFLHMQSLKTFRSWSVLEFRTAQRHQDAAAIKEWRTTASKAQSPWKRCMVLQ